MPQPWLARRQLCCFGRFARIDVPRRIPLPRLAVRGLLAPGLLWVLCSLPLACGDEESAADPVALCAELCSRNQPQCTGDGTLAQCKLNCERWYDLCPEPARIYYGCYNSQFEADVVCDDDTNRSRLADGLCDREQQNFEFCLEEGD